MIMINLDFLLIPIGILIVAYSVKFIIALRRRRKYRLPGGAKYYE